MENTYSAYRKAYPSGKIEQRIVSHDKNGCMAEARVYEDKGDPEQAFLANGFAFRSSDSGGNYIENTLLAALKCAILAAGISLENENDSPVREGKPRKKETVLNKAALPDPTIENADDKEDGDSSGEESSAGTPTIVVPVVGGETTSVSQLLVTMTRKEAEAVEVPKGAGMDGIMTMKEIAIKRPASLKWYAEEYKGPDSRIPAAARILLGAAYKSA